MVCLIISTYGKHKDSDQLVKSVFIKEPIKLNSEKTDVNCNDNLETNNFIYKQHVNLIYKNNIDHYFLNLFIIELSKSNDLYNLFLNQIATILKQNKINSNNLNNCQILIKFKLKDASLYPLFRNWYNKISQLYLSKMNLELSFTWLSTLGGAYYKLGDDYENFAFKAASISKNQLKLAIQLNDTFNISRCLIYITFSLIQRGNLNDAAKLMKKIIYPYIKNSYANNTSSKEYLILKIMYKAAKFTYLL